MKNVIDLVVGIASGSIGLVGFDNHSLMVLKALWNWDGHILILKVDLSWLNWLFILIGFCDRLSSLAILIWRLNSLDIEVFLSPFLSFLGWWSELRNAEELSALGHAQLWLHLVDVGNWFGNGLVIEVDVIVRLCPESHHLNFVFTLTFDELLFGVWVVVSHLSGIWGEEVFVSTSSRLHIDLRVTSWEVKVSAILISILVHWDAGVLIVSINWERLLLVIRRLLMHRLYFQTKSIWWKSNVVVPIEIIWGDWGLDEGLDESALVWALKCVGSMKLEWLTSLVRWFWSHLLFVKRGELINVHIAANHLHWLDFDVDWLDLIVVSETDIALGNFDNGSVIIESLLLGWWKAVVWNLFDLHSVVV